jgi:enoyl-CoA hydratase
MAEFIRTSDPRDHVRVITMSRPERLNALSFETVEPLRAALAEAEADNDVWVVVLHGAGDGFCSGLDLEDAGVPPGAEGLPLSRLAARAMEYMADMVPQMRGMPQPVIAAVHGAAVGGGMCLSLGADIRLAGESAYWRAAGINNGLGAVELGLSYTLPRAIGASRAFEICLSGREVDSAEAERIGLVSRVVPDGDLLDTSLDLAERICGWSTQGVASTKQLLWSALEINSLEAAIELENRNQLLIRMTTDNLEEYIRARREGRTPVYAD